MLGPMGGASGGGARRSRAGVTRRSPPGLRGGAGAGAARGPAAPGDLGFRGGCGGWQPGAWECSHSAGAILGEWMGRAGGMGLCS